MLSATISGAENLLKWVGELKQKSCHLIPTDLDLFLCIIIYSIKELYCVKDNISWKEKEWTNVMNTITKDMKKKKVVNINLGPINLKQLFEGI